MFGQRVASLALVLGAAHPLGARVVAPSPVSRLATWQWPRRALSRRRYKPALQCQQERWFQQHQRQWVWLGGLMGPRREYSPGPRAQCCLVSMVPASQLGVHLEACWEWDNVVWYIVRLSEHSSQMVLLAFGGGRPGFLPATFVVDDILGDPALYEASHCPLPLLDGKRSLARGCQSPWCIHIQTAVVWPQRTTWMDSWIHSATGPGAGRESWASRPFGHRRSRHREDSTWNLEGANKPSRVSPTGGGYPFSVPSLLSEHPRGCWVRSTPLCLRSLRQPRRRCPSCAGERHHSTCHGARPAGDSW